MQLHTRMTLIPVTICLVLAILLSMPASAQPVTISVTTASNTLLPGV
ncbi:hypothetical protein SAMN02983003_0991 [Devosia enhydra]|uniref:Uncharacterized protein n=1 Tax=Devosia enhydra TaxID=665118 RepID=A0A1K2HUT8_9HYPH|nr:hypothetical protein [Devosia enhydra]SFZ82290.1 hypothetical protein SAMN02983003_0991 [Devosia enhydra]